MSSSTQSLPLSHASAAVWKKSWLIPLFGLVLFASIAVATALGTVAIPLSTTTRLLAQGLLQLPVEGDERALATIVYLLRLPRVLAAALVGASLALAGTMMQGLFRNPLADAGLIGVSSGGALGGALAISSGFAVGSSFLLPCATFAGALLSAFGVYLFAARQGRTSLANLLLVGIAVNAIWGSLTTLILSLAKDYEISRQIFFWLMGGLDGRGWAHVQMVFPFAAIGFLPAFFLSRDLNILLLGEETALSLGLNVEYAKRILLVFASLLAGAAVAIAGTISFVGLVIPHMMRLILGPNHRLLLPGAALGGAAFLVWCDLFARMVIPSVELQLGVITAVVGAPLFLHLLLRQDKAQRNPA